MSERSRGNRDEEPPEDEASTKEFGGFKLFQEVKIPEQLSDTFDDRVKWQVSGFGEDFDTRTNQSVEYVEVMSLRPKLPDFSDVPTRTEWKTSTVKVPLRELQELNPSAEVSKYQIARSLFGLKNRSAKDNHLVSDIALIEKSVEDHNRQYYGAQDLVKGATVNVTQLPGLGDEKPQLAEVHYGRSKHEEQVAILREHVSTRPGKKTKIGLQFRVGTQYLKDDRK